MRKRDTTRRCFIYIELGYLAKNCINTRGIDDEKKAKANNIKRQMKQKWIQKSPMNASLSHEVYVTQELVYSNIST